MTEHQPKPDNQNPSREVSGTIVFDEYGQAIGLAVNDGSLDYASQIDKENTVVVIRPPKEGK